MWAAHLIALCTCLCPDGPVVRQWEGLGASAAGHANGVVSRARQDPSGPLPRRYAVGGPQAVTGCHTPAPLIVTPAAFTLPHLGKQFWRPSCRPLYNQQLQPQVSESSRIPAQGWQRRLKYGAKLLFCMDRVFFGDELAHKIVHHIAAGGRSSVAVVAQ